MNQTAGDWKQMATLVRTLLGLLRSRSSLRSVYGKCNLASNGCKEGIPRCAASSYRKERAASRA